MIESIKKYLVRFGSFVLNLLNVSTRRLMFSFFYNKDWFLLQSSEDVFDEIYNTNLWESDESKSGGGSTLEATAVMRAELPELIKKYNIKSMLDAPCGDYNWMKEVPKYCSYIGGDIVHDLIKKNQELYSSEKVQFQQLDLTKDKLPEVDLVFCKDCLQHLSYEHAKDAINNIKNSGSKYLLVTSYHKTKRNHDIHSGDYRALNLHKSPFNLKGHLDKIEEKPRSVNTEFDKTMYLYELAKIPAL